MCIQQQCEANVIPSAPPTSNLEPESYHHLYLVLQPEPERFRLNKIAKIEKQLAGGPLSPCC